MIPVSAFAGPSAVAEPMADRMVAKMARHGRIAVAVADFVRHPRDPGAMLRRAEEFSFPAFKQRLASALAV